MFTRLWSGIFLTCGTGLVYWGIKEKKEGIYFILIGVFLVAVGLFSLYFVRKKGN